MPSTFYRIVIALLVLLSIPVSAQQTRNRITMAIKFPSGDISVDFATWEGEHARVSLFPEQGGTWQGYLWPRVTANGVVTVTITDGHEADADVLDVVTLTVGDDFVQTHTIWPFGLTVRGISP